jgi:hypothetical protein
VLRFRFLLTRNPERLAKTGTLPASLTPATLAFGNQAVAVASASKTATFKNTQAVAMTIDSIAISGGTAPGDYASTTTCPISPSTLDAGASLFYLFNLLEGRSILK